SSRSRPLWRSRRPGWRRSSHPASPRQLNRPSATNCSCALPTRWSGCRRISARWSSCGTSRAPRSARSRRSWAAPGSRWRACCCAAGASSVNCWPNGREAAMSAERGTFPERDEYLLDTVLSYLEDVDTGQPPDPQEVVACHPDLGGELTAFFADQDEVSGLL